MQIFDHRDKRPIYEQVAERFQTLILHGVYQTDEQLPSVRSVAMENAVNPNTIQKAYAELERRGFIYSVRGRGSFVAPVEPLLDFKRKELLKQLRELCRDAQRLGITVIEMREEIERCYGEVEEND